MRFRPKLGHALFLAATLTGCAGPASPLGAINAASPEKARLKPSELALGADAAIDKLVRPEIEFKPRRQVLHAAASFRVRVRDPLGITPNYRVRVFHNGYDVTDAFQAQATTTVQPGAREMEVVFRGVRFQAAAENEVSVVYYREARESAAAAAKLAPPACRAFSQDKVAMTGNFRASEALLRMIEKHAAERGYNPAYVTGLIAEESGFDRNAVSWERAIGLTQVAVSSENSVLSKFPAFPSYPGLNAMSAARIKALVLLGKVHGGNEWRLNEEMSVQGGLVRLDFVRRFWYAPENFAIVQNSFQDTEAGIAQVILASYRAGPTKVKRALLAHGANWLREDEALDDVQAYIHRIFSYCYHFSEQPRKVKDANST